MSIQSRHRPCAETLSSEMTPEELAYLRELLQQSGLKGAHLEIGTAAGGTLCELMLCYEAQVRPKFVVVDPMTYFPNQLEIIQRNLSGKGLSSSAVEFRTQTSAALFARARQAGDRFDFILIDGNHKIRYVMRDLAWTELLQPGGLVCLHDYNANHPGVQLAACYFLATNSNFEFVGKAGSLFAMRKKAGPFSPAIRWHHILLAEIANPLFQLWRSLAKRL